MPVTPSLSPTPIEVILPEPWPKQMRFCLEDLPPLTWLVGPNGTGKSRFLHALRDCPPLQRMRTHLVSTDRLNQARFDEGLAPYIGQPFRSGLPKSNLSAFANLNQRSGNLIGTVALLHGRPDLRDEIRRASSGKRIVLATHSPFFLDIKTDAARYLILCNALGKKALFIFDLDALFDRRLSTGAGQNAELTSRIKQAGHIDYDRLLGQLQRALGEVAKNFLELKPEMIPASLAELRTCLEPPALLRG